jgi:hypothetical protein
VGKEREVQEPAPRRNVKENVHELLLQIVHVRAISLEDAGAGTRRAVQRTLNKHQCWRNFKS